MAKNVKAIIKLQIEAGKANPAPPVGTALGPHGINIGQFCSQYNEATKDKSGEIIPAEIIIYKDRTFSFKLKTPPTSFLLRRAAGIKKGSSDPFKNKVGKVSSDQIKEIAERKMDDLNARSLNAAIKIVEGTARSMGINIK